MAIKKNGYFCSPFLENENNITVNTLSYKTVSANKQTVEKNWVLIDAEGQTLGRLASNVAKILRGKNKPSFTPHVDTGDNVIVINAEKIKLTGNKEQAKTYIRHTGYPGGMRQTPYLRMLKEHPTRVVEYAVRGMLPKNRLGRVILKNLYVYAGSEHKHAAQKPTTIDLNKIKL